MPIPFQFLMESTNAIFLKLLNILNPNIFSYHLCIFDKLFVVGHNNNHIPSYFEYFLIHMVPSQKDKLF
jgi:hypothetical protein